MLIYRAGSAPGRSHLTGSDSGSAGVNLLATDRSGEGPIIGAEELHWGLGKVRESRGGGEWTKLAGE